MSTSKAMFYDLFNEKAIEFLKDLIESFPELGTDFQRVKTGLIALSSVNPKSPQQIFHNYVLSKYKDAIMNKDEAVFLHETNFDIYSTRKEHWLEFIDHIKGIWQTLDANNKETIWKYFRVLVVLSDKCSA